MPSGSAVHQAGGEPNRAEQEKHGREKAYIQRNIEGRGERRVIRGRIGGFWEDFGYSIRLEGIGVPQYGDSRGWALKRWMNRGRSHLDPAVPTDARFKAKDGTKFKEGAMLGWAIGFFIVALIAAVLGFSGVAVAAAGIAKILFFIFLVLFLVSLVGHLLRRT